MDNRKVPQAVIGRLPRYYRYLGELREEGVERISSGELSARMGASPSQVRQDLNHFGGFGQQGYGYHVENLYKEIARLLGLDQQHLLVVIGAGNLGQALANYGNFEKRGFKICAMFDENPALVGTTTEKGIPILHIDELEKFLRKTPADIAVMAIPKNAAVPVAKRLCGTCVRGIWNFSHTDLEVGEGMVVENVHLSESLMKLSYRLDGGV